LNLDMFIPFANGFARAPLQAQGCEIVQSH